MSGNMSTDLGTSALPDETRAAVRRYLTRTGNADLVDVLGLGDEPARPTVCEQGHPLSRLGACRRTERCRADTDRKVEAARARAGTR